MPIKVMPDEQGWRINPSSHLNVKIVVRDNDTKEKPIDIFSIKFSGRNEGLAATETSPRPGKYCADKNLQRDENGDLEIFETQHSNLGEYDGARQYTNKLYIPSSLPLWRFFESDPVPDVHGMTDENYYQTIAELLPILRLLESALETGDIDSVMQLFEERNRETDLAFYEKPGTTEIDLRKAILNTYNNPDLTLSKIGDDKKLGRLRPSFLFRPALQTRGNGWRMALPYSWVRLGEERCQNFTTDESSLGSRGSEPCSTNPG